MRTIKELLEAAEKEKISLGEISLRWQAEKSHETLESVRAKMGERLQAGTAFRFWAGRRSSRQDGAGGADGPLRRGQ